MRNLVKLISAATLCGLLAGKVLSLEIRTTFDPTKVKKAGDTMTGSLTMGNNIAIRALDLAGNPMDMLKVDASTVINVGGVNTNYIDFKTGDGTPKLRIENDGMVQLMKNDKYLRGTDVAGFPIDLLKVDVSTALVLGGGNINYIAFKTGAGTTKAMIANDGSLRIGGDGMGPVGTVFGGDIDIANESPSGIGVASYESGMIWGSFVYGARYRGTKLSPLAVQPTDVLMEFGGTGWDGSGAPGGGELMFVVDDTVSPGVVPTRADLYVTDSTGVFSRGMIVHRDRVLEGVGGLLTYSSATASSFWGNGANITSLTPANMSAGSLPSNVIASSIAVNAVDDKSIVDVAGGKVVGDIPGNADSINGSITPAQVSAGSLPGDVIVSSVAVGAVEDASIVGVSGGKVSGDIAGNAGSITGSINAGQINAGNLPADVLLTSEKIQVAMTHESTVTITAQDGLGFSLAVSSGISAQCITLQGGQVCGPSAGGGGAPSGPAGGELSGTYPDPTLSGKMDAPLVAKSSVTFEDGNFSVAGTTLAVLKGRVEIGQSSASIAYARLEVNGGTVFRGRVGIYTGLTDATYQLVVASGLYVQKGGLRMENGIQSRAFVTSRWSNNYSSKTIAESGILQQFYGVCHDTITITISGAKTTYINFVGMIKTDVSAYELGINILKDGQFIPPYDEIQGVVSCNGAGSESKCNASFSLILPPDDGAVTGDSHSFCLTTASPDNYLTTTSIVDDTYSSNTFSVMEGAPLDAGKL